MTMPSELNFKPEAHPNEHCVLWVKGAPKYGSGDVTNVCQFIDQYITCAIPKEEGKLKDLVLLLQQHKHSLIAKGIEDAVLISLIHPVIIHS